MQGKHIDRLLDDVKVRRLHEIFSEVAHAQNMSWMAVRDDYYSDDPLYKEHIDQQMLGDFGEYSWTIKN